MQRVSSKFVKISKNAVTESAGGAGWGLGSVTQKRHIYVSREANFFSFFFGFFIKFQW